MSFFSRRKRQRGEIILTILFITTIGGTILYTMGRVMQSEKQHVDRVYEQLGRGEIPSNEEIDRARKAVNNVAQFSGASGQVLSTVSNIGAPGQDAARNELIKKFGEVAIDRVVTYGTSEPARNSDRLPADVPQFPICGRNSRNNCTSKSACTNAGGYWHSDNTCQNAPSCDKNYLSYCTNSGECTAASGYWNADNVCRSTSDCNSSHLNLCTSKSDCSNAGGYWHSDNVCRNVPDCDSDHLNMCLNKSECTTAGGYWHSDNVCRNTPDCDSEHLSLCANSGECSGAGGFWYDNQCNVSPSNCYTGTFSSCRTESDCGNAGGYWYDSSCHKDPQNPCGEGGTFNCSNGSQICADKACNGRNDCGDNSDEANCGTESSCCISTNGCPSETATSCGETCCCCPYGQACDRANPARGCISY